MIPDHREKFTRSSTLARLRERLGEGMPIVAVAASAGITAGSAEAAGADLIVVTSAGRSRLRGLPTYQSDNDNADTLQLYSEIANVVDVTPIIGGLNATDPMWRRLPELVDQFVATGYDGLINSPSVGVHAGEVAYLRSNVDLGFDRELRMIEEAHKRDVVAITVVYEPEQAKAASEQGSDVIVVHGHWRTEAGPTPFGQIDRSFDDACAWIDAIGDQIVGDPIVLFQGGPHILPEEAASIYSRTRVRGFLARDSIESIAVGREIERTVTEFKARRLRATARTFGITA